MSRSARSIRLIRRQMQDEFLRLQAQLKKTIVFITHDFLEALQLADRIAIMRRGRFVQVGTGADLVLRPVDDYVADFTRDVPRDKVLTAGSIAEPVSDRLDGAEPVSAEATLDVVMQLLAEREAPIAVAGSRGQNHRPDHGRRRGRGPGRERGPAIMSIGVESRISAGRPPPSSRRLALACSGGGRRRTSGAKGSGLLAPSPPAPLLPVAEWISAAMAWFTQQFRDFFRAITWLLGWPFGWIQSLLLWIPWPAIVLICAALGYLASGWSLAAFCAVALLYIVVTGYWEKTALTLAAITVAVPLSIASGLLIGIWGFRSRPRAATSSWPST